MPRVVTNDDVIKEIRRLGNIEEFEPELKSAAAQSVGRLIRTTPRKTGDTARGWSNVQKISKGAYRTVNAKLTPATAEGKRYLLPAILNEGSRPHEITPKKAKKLRFKVGGQVVFAGKVNHPGTKGTHFIDKEVDKASSELTRIMKEKIDRITK